MGALRDCWQRLDAGGPRKVVHLFAVSVASVVGGTLCAVGIWLTRIHVVQYFFVVLLFVCVIAMWASLSLGVALSATLLRRRIRPKSH